MDDQKKIKYLKRIEQALVNEWTETRKPETQPMIDKIREELRRLRSTWSRISSAAWLVA